MISRNTPKSSSIKNDGAKFFGQEKNGSAFLLLNLLDCFFFFNVIRTRRALVWVVVARKCRSG